MVGRRRAVLGGALVLFVGMGRAAADDPVAATEGDYDTTVVAPRPRGPQATSPEAGEVVDTTEARRESADMGALLDRTKGVTLRRSGGLGAPTTFYLQGFYGKRVRFLVDGLPAELQGLGLSPADIPVNLIERVEIYKGVVPIRFGADALGGAVNFVTRAPGDRTSLESSLELASFGTFRASTVANVSLVPSLGLFARADAFFDRSDNDYRVRVETVDERGQLHPETVRRFHDGYEAHGLGLELGVRGRRWADRLSLGVFRSDSDKDLQNNPRMTVPYGDITQGEGATGVHGHYRLAPARFGVGVELDASVALRDGRFDDVSRNQWDWHGEVVRSRPNPGERSAGSRVRSDATIAAARLGLTWRLARDHRLELSVSPAFNREERTTQLTIGTDLDPQRRDYEQFKLASGLSWRLRLFGARLENDVFAKHYFANASAPGSTGAITDTEVGPPTHRLGAGESLRATLWGPLHLKASYEYAIRLPDPQELFGDGALIDASPGLSPETSHNANLGLILDGLDTPVGRFAIDAGGFVRRARDFIFLSVALDRAQYQNISDVDTVGAEVGLVWAWRDMVTLGANVSYVDATSQSTGGFFGRFKGDRIPNLPYLTGNASAAVTVRPLAPRAERLRFFWYGRYVHQYFLFWEGEGDPDLKLFIPGHVTQTAGVSLGSGDDRWTATFEAQNLTDEKVFDNVGVQLAGRSWHFKLVFGLDVPATVSSTAPQPID